MNPLRGPPAPARIRRQPPGAETRLQLPCDCGDLNPWPNSMRGSSDLAGAGLARAPPRPPRARPPQGRVRLSLQWASWGLVAGPVLAAALRRSNLQRLPTRTRLQLPWWPGPHAAAHGHDPPTSCMPASAHQGRQSSYGVVTKHEANKAAGRWPGRMQRGACEAPGAARRRESRAARGRLRGVAPRARSLGRACHAPYGVCSARGAVSQSGQQWLWRGVPPAVRGRGARPCQGGGWGPPPPRRRAGGPRSKVWGRASRRRAAHARACAHARAPTGGPLPAAAAARGSVRGRGRASEVAGRVRGAGAQGVWRPHAPNNSAVGWGARWQ